jgi:hypothetical protein
MLAENDTRVPHVILFNLLLSIHPLSATTRRPLCHGRRPRWELAGPPGKVAVMGAGCAAGEGRCDAKGGRAGEILRVRGMPRRRGQGQSHVVEGGWSCARAASRACLRRSDGDSPGRSRGQAPKPRRGHACAVEEKGGVGEGSPEMAGDGEGGPGKEQPIEWPDPVMARWGGSVAAPLWCSCSSVGRRRVRAGGEEEGENR